MNQKTEPQPDRRQNTKLNKPPVLFSKTQSIISKIERELGHTFIAYWNSPGGSVCQNDVIGLYGVLRKLGHRDTIVLFIKSDGGSGQASLRMINLLRQYAGRLVAVVPLTCASAATMMAIGADEIQMGPLAYLTAVDTSITHELSPVDHDNDLVSVSQDELQRVIKLWRQEATGSNETNPYQALFPYIHPLVIGAVDRASFLSTKICQEILSYHLTEPNQANDISHTLNSNYPTHNYPITLREAKQIGLNAMALDLKINDLLIELNELYSEMGQRALTDYDEENYHNNEIINIIEGHTVQIYYQIDKDWHYRKEERRWTSLNDESSWRKVERIGRQIKRSVFHVR